MESEVTDEDLDTEFMEYTALETITESPTISTTTTATCVPPHHTSVVINPTTASAAVTTTMPSQELKTSVFERRGAGMV